MADRAEIEPYSVPDVHSSIRALNWLDPTKARDGHESLEDFFARNHFAALADLRNPSHFRPDEIEEAVRSGFLAFAVWPEERPRTHLFWQNDEPTKKILAGLATKVVDVVIESDAGLRLTEVGERVGADVAFSGLVYAREQGYVEEVSEDTYNGNGGPLYRRPEPKRDVLLDDSAAVLREMLGETV